VRIRALDHTELELVGPAWRSLLAHHGSIEPMPIRAPDESWAMRRSDYERWLSQPGSFVLVAEDERGVAGYALVEVRGPDETWQTGDRTAELQTLAVLPDHRGAGVGTLLMDEVDAELDRQDVGDLWVHVSANNVDALRFYEGRGLRTYMHAMYRRGR
jgi:ribosomal protein S18 acetylase RimI-like enzyme